MLPSLVQGPGRTRRKKLKRPGNHICDENHRLGSEPCRQGYLAFRAPAPPSLTGVLRSLEAQIIYVKTLESGVF